jgi:peptide/nickel transport system substrate-binding protein
LTAAPTASPAPTHLTFCLAAEPESLYAYRAYTSRATHLAAEHVRQALFDGPIDPYGFERRPVIVEELPTLENGGAAVETVAVLTGDRYYDPATGQVTEWREAETQMQRLVMTYRLRQGLLWSDGEPLTAGDSVFAFELVLQGADPRMQPAVLPQTAQRTAAYEALDDYTVRWTGVPGYAEHAPLAAFFTFFSPLPRHQLGESDPTQMPGNLEAGRRPLGWGPYLLKEWAPGEAIRLERNPLYFRAAEGLPRADTVTFVFEPDPVEALDAVSSGACDAALHESFGLRHASLIPAIDAAAAAGSLSVTYQADPAWEHLDFNLSPLDERPAVFADAAVRQAAALCLDRQALAEAAYPGHGVAAAGLAPPGSPYLPAETALYPAREPAAGQAALAAAGWNAAGGVAVKDGVALEVELLLPNGEAGEQLASLVADQLSECGFAVTPRFASAEEITGVGALSPVFRRQFDLALFAWRGDPGGEPQCALYTTTQIPSEENLWTGLNATGFSDTAYDAACQAARQAGPEAASRAAHQEAQRLLAAGLPTLPLFHRLQWAVTRPGVQGLSLAGIALDDLASELIDIEQVTY